MTATASVSVVSLVGQLLLLSHRRACCFTMVYMCFLVPVLSFRMSHREKTMEKKQHLLRTSRFARVPGGAPLMEPSLSVGFEGSESTGRCERIVVPIVLSSSLQMTGRTRWRVEPLTSWEELTITQANWLKAKPFHRGQTPRTSPAEFESPRLVGLLK